MADGDDLPDGDYASIDGHEALHARQLAQLDALLRKQDEVLAQIWARAEARRQREEDT